MFCPYNRKKYQWDEQESIHTIEREEEFDFKKFIIRFAHSSILSSYIDVLRTYTSNTPYLNHCIIRMFYRISIDCNYPGIFFQMSLFRIYQKFYLDPLAKSQQFSELLQFGTWLLRKFFVTIQKNPYIYAELLFWKDRSILEDMLDGYRHTTRTTNEGEKKIKAGSWSIEHQIELRDLFRKIKEEQVENIGLEQTDIIDRIMLELTDKTKTRRQIIKELKNQDLIKNTRELKLKKTRNRQSKKNNFLDNSKFLSSDSDVPDIDDDDDDDRSIENKSISSEHEQDNSKSDNIISTEIPKNTEQEVEEEEESVPVIIKQSRKFESSSMFNDNDNDNDNDDDDDDISSSRPIKKARRQLASSSEDDD
ncbi:unnamed protein product [Rotaria sordida]|uniref:Uncharacterized protein n=1 Tax=Rotaria sordida TaxID=392033 RepID=A0A818Y6U2_9BILA|nr:unnamed protein product [Rotaria sordida]